MRGPWRPGACQRGKNQPGGSAVAVRPLLSLAGRGEGRGVGLNKPAENCTSGAGLLL
jgi:hypothetical protein